MPEKIKIALFTDLHYGNNVENKCGKVVVNIHGENIKDLIVGLRDEIEKINPSLVFNLGDSAQANSAEEAKKLYQELNDIFCE